MKYCDIENEYYIQNLKRTVGYHNECGVSMTSGLFYEMGVRVDWGRVSDG